MKSSLPKIGIDLDGVCADFSGRFLEESRVMFGIPEEDYVQLKWEFKDCGIPPKLEDIIFQRMRNTKNFWETLGKCRGTNRLGDILQRYEPVFITKRFETAGKSARAQSANWISKNFGIAHPTVIVTEKKGHVAAALDLFAFIDDKPSNCESVYIHAASCRHMVFLKDAPYNKECESFIRVPTLDAFLERLP